MIGNVSSNTGILTLQGENDTQTPVQQACMLQQRLTELNHPDHMLITYPGPGHQSSPVIGYFRRSGMFLQKPGPTEEYVLAHLYAWLESHYSFGLAYHPYAIVTHKSSTNISLRSTNVTSSSSSGK
jgi:hypothetical protein